MDAVRKKKEKTIPAKVVSEVLHIAFSVYWKEGIGQKLKFYLHYSTEC